MEKHLHTVQCVLVCVFGQSVVDGRFSQSRCWASVFGDGG